MLTTEQQLAELGRVVAMCKGTKLEGKEALCVKQYSKHENCYYNYVNLYGVLFPNINLIKPYIEAKNKPILIFAVAIVEDTPIFLEEPFTLTHPQYQGRFVYNKDKHSLDTVEPVYQKSVGMLVSIPIDRVIWAEFKLYKPEGYSTPEGITYKQVGGDHYRNKAIQPWAYMEANYPKEQFIGFLRGNIHKYLDRYKDKNGVEDLQKAMHYLEKLIEIESEDK